MSQQPHEPETEDATAATEPTAPATEQQDEAVDAGAGLDTDVEGIATEEAPGDRNDPV